MCMNITTPNISAKLLTNQPMKLKRIENYVMCMNITTPNISAKLLTNQPMKLNELKTM